ncbi:MAG TPA: hypothetical protein PK413_13120 [Thermoanaerobaculia bacterium]|nr:hypothetical protein [Thermoanaerobaculia bacterium]
MTDRWLARLGGGLLGLGLAAMAAASPSNTYVPPLPPRTNKALLAGEKLWSSEKLAGPGGQSCAGCHDSPRGTQLSSAMLQRKLDDLPKLVYFELVAHCNNRRVEYNGPEVEALVAHLKRKYDLRAAPLADNPQAQVAVEVARQYFLQGDFDKARGLLENSLRLTATPNLAAETHLWLGAIFDVTGDQVRAMREFAEVFRLFPDAKIDDETFSPKTVALFETVRELTNANRREASRRAP